MKRFSFTLVLVIFTTAVMAGIISSAESTGTLSVKGGAQKPELTEQNGHSGWLRSLVFSKNGKYLISGSEDKTLKLWDTEDMRLIRTLRGHRDSVRDVALSSDGNTAASGSGDGTVKLWDISTGKCTATFQAGSSINSVAFSPDGRTLASGSIGSQIMLWDVKSGTCTATLKGHTSWIESLCFSSDGKLLLSGSSNYKDRSDDTVRIWDVKSGKCLNVLKGHKDGVVSAAFSPDGKTAASASEDKTVKVWDVATGRCLRSIEGFSGELQALSFSPDGREIAACGRGKDIHVYDAAKGTLLKTFTGKSTRITALCYSMDGKRLAAGDSDWRITLWDNSSGKIIKVFTDNSGWVSALCFSPDGTGIASARLRTDVLSITEGRPSGEFNSEAGVYSVVYSRDGRAIIAGYSNGTIEAVSSPSLKSIRKLIGHTGAVYSLAVSPDGKLIASGGEDKTLRLWDSSTGKCLAVLDGHRDKVRSVTFTPDGRSVISGSSDETVKVWNVAAKTCTMTLKDKNSHYSVYAVACSPDGRILASGNSDGTVRLWDLRSGNLMMTLKGHNNMVNGIAFSPDGKRLASGGDDNTGRIWEVSSGQCLNVLEGHSGDVNAIAFSPDGRIIASGSSDTSVKFWDVSTGKLLLSYIYFSDGNWVATTAEGYFDCSDKGKQYLGWTMGMKNYPLEQFYDEFYTPGLISSVLKGEKIVKKHDLRRGFEPPPEVSITASKSGARGGIENLEVTICATDRGGGVDDIRLYHQGKLVDPAGRNLQIKSGQDKTKTVRYLITPLNGENILSATAYNGTHTVESVPFRLVIQSSQAVRKAKAFIVVVGINSYRDGHLNLHSARQDAEAIAASFKSKGQSLFAEEKVLTLYDADATKGNIVKALEEICAMASPEDVVVIFFSGHGDVDPSDGTYYFIPSDFDTKLPIESMYKNSGLSIRQIQSITGRIKARKVLAMFDTCHAGRALSAFRGMADVKAMKMLAKSSGLHLLAASTDEQLAGEVKILGHGVFTSALLEGMDGGADANRDGIITVRELLTYVEERTDELSEKYLGRRQYPVADSRGMDFPILLK